MIRRRQEEIGKEVGAARASAVSRTRTVSSSGPWALIDSFAFAAILIAVGTLPFEFTKVWFPVSWIEVSRLFMVLAVVSSAPLAIRARALPHPALIVATSVMVAVGAISLALAPSPSGAKDLGAMCIYFLFTLSIAFGVRTTDRLRLVALAIITSALIVALVAIGEELFGVNLWRDTGFGAIGRRNSTLADPNITARVLLIGFVTLLGLVAARPTGHSSASAGVGAALLGAATALTQSRVIWALAVLVGLLLLTAIVRRRSTLLVLGLFGLGLVTPLVLIPAAGARVDSLDAGGIGSMAADPGTFEGGMLTGPPTPVDGILAALPLDGVRRYLIRAGVAMWIDHPVLGVGLGGFDQAIRGPYWDYVPPDRRSEPVTLNHTDVVRVAAEMGLIGVIAWGAFVATYVWRALRLALEDWPGRCVGVTLLAVFGIILAASQFAGRFTSEPYLWVAIAICVAAPAALRGRGTEVVGR